MLICQLIVAGTDMSAKTDHVQVSNNYRLSSEQKSEGILNTFTP